MSITEIGNGRVRMDSYAQNEVIRFGPKADQLMPATWAERILTALATSPVDKDRKRFGELLAAAALGE